MAKSKMNMTEHSILKGIEDAIAIGTGTKKPAHIHKIELPHVDVKSVRGRTGLSQPNFANMVGVSVSTLRNWEQGRRTPEGPAKVLLAMVNKDPTIVRRCLRDSMTGRFIKATSMGPAAGMARQISSKTMKRNKPHEKKRA